MNPSTACWTLDSVLDSVDTGERRVVEFTGDLGFEPSDRDLIGLAVREVLINAIKHGNRFDPARKVQLRLTRDASVLTIEVTDEGAGFRLEDVPDPRVGSNRERRSGRGLTIAAAIMDELTVSGAVPRGSHVRMVKRLPQRTFSQ